MYISFIQILTDGEKCFFLLVDPKGSGSVFRQNAFGSNNYSQRFVGAVLNIFQKRPRITTFSFLIPSPIQQQTIQARLSDTFIAVLKSTLYGLTNEVDSMVSRKKCDHIKAVKLSWHFLSEE